MKTSTFSELKKHVPSNIIIAPRISFAFVDDVFVWRRGGLTFVPRRTLFGSTEATVNSHLYEAATGGCALSHQELAKTAGC